MYKELGIIKEKFNKPILAITATATKYVMNDIMNILNMNQNIYKMSFDRPNLELYVYEKDNKTFDDIYNEIKNSRTNY
jgi:superfamily II DNA helicase RecQ